MTNRFTQNYPIKERIAIFAKDKLWLKQATFRQCSNRFGIALNLHCFCRKASVPCPINRLTPLRRRSRIWLHKSAKHRVNRIKTIHGTLAIEGNTLSTEQVTAVLEGKPVVAPINEVQEVRNALKAYELLDTLDPCKVDDLLKAHATMEAGLIDEIGCFRKGGAGVVSGKTVIHYAPDAERVPFLVNDMFEWLRTTDEHPLIASCVFHYEFEFIHPFADGNSRTGRLWQTLILSRWRPIFKNLPIENIVYKYQKEYCRAIAVSGGKAGCTPFVEFVLGVIAETLTTQETPRKTTQEIILEAIARNPSITRAELAEVVGISPDGVKYHLQKLAKSGRLKRVGSARRGEWVIG